MINIIDWPDSYIVRQTIKNSFIEYWKSYKTLSFNKQEVETAATLTNDFDS